jgi:hypothetical protein
MCAAVIRKNKVVCTLPVSRVLRIMYAAGGLVLRTGSIYFICAAAAAAVPDKGKALTARKYKDNQYQRDKR